MRIALSSKIDCNYGSTTETGCVKYYQNLIPKQILSDESRSLHGEVGKHHGTTQTKIAYREKDDNPNMTHLMRD